MEISLHKIEHGIVNVLLIQENYPDNLIGKELGEGIHGGVYNGDLMEYSQTPQGISDIQNFKNILENIPPDIDIAIISEHRGNKLCLHSLQKKADENNQIIITRLGYYDRGNGLGIRNSIAVFVPHEKEIMIDKIAFTAEDHKLDKDNKLQRGEHIHVIESPFGRIALLNCFDYTHADFLYKLADQNIDILIILAFNPASQLFNQYAIADMHRLFCFVIISNIANYGGSGVFAPFRRIGRKFHGVTLGGVLSLEKGPNVAYLKVPLELGSLRKIREILREEGSIESKKEKLDDFLPPILPPETFLGESQKCYKDILDLPNSLKIVDLKDRGYIPSMKNGRLSIGVAHLRGMEIEDYLENYYHISSSKNIVYFENYIKCHLKRLYKQLKDKEETLDFLVFPEVFMPLGLLPELEKFSNEFNTIIISGVEYDQQTTKPVVPEDAFGVNRCFIYIPTTTETGERETKRFEYIKLTRSQYDAQTPPKEKDGPIGQFKMKTGEEVIRFSHPDIGQFGVLICYDFSHLDILQKINREATMFPPEILFVPAYNPDSNLYESCCMADCHRFYQYIVMCNVAQYGGSGVFGPLKNKGARQILLKAGIMAEGISVVSIDIQKLREARTTNDLMLKDNFPNYQKKPGIFDYDGRLS